MDVTEKSLGVLIDELFTTSLKCWFAQEVVMHSEDEAEVYKAAKTAQRTNARRNLLIRAIDERVGEQFASPTEKTYA